ncbi:Type 1 glutamine amidotransferase-like domain-containing protein [Candidatus Nitronereus thalassa]|uniref:Type 1 glutamine amidotransferase-like domain-containing protein n=1 Tax=Candidatus Nitronereus thalassa TaxID=3020898 RepID=A0ABU3KCG1_9BACT|nr:Type 1 glutamine amidotransferase-like domain-containing protein [Candidatus Nitronereus thalassa]MDT7044111.1 Type 1 glutamine amidotransferase-like domain-containing protein [Candidatus Nitronereus thalassa]
MKLVLYSGGQTTSNRLIHHALFQLVNPKRNKSMTYIPYCQDGSDLFFKRAIKRYQGVGFKRFHCLPVDVPYTRQDLQTALRSDVIYLAGGNTFYFLKHLKKSGLIPQLKTFVERGGVLAGLSAGAIMLTPHIGTAGPPLPYPDENDVKLKNLRALGLVRFEFYPHYASTLHTNQAILRYSRTTKYPIFACPDGSGITINEHRMTFIGKVLMFFGGKKVEIF